MGELVDDHPNLGVPMESTAHWLPPELILLIVEYALTPYDTQFALSLSVVSSWTRRVVLPHIFSTLSIRNLPEKHDVLPPHLGTHVQNLLIQRVGASWTNATAFFDNCPNATSITLPSQYMWSLHRSIQRRYLASSQSNSSDGGELWSRCHSLSIFGQIYEPLSPFLTTQPGLAFLHQLTHLEITLSNHISVDRISLSALPNLTHIAGPIFYLIHPTGVERDLQEYLARERLEKLVLTVNHHSGLALIFGGIQKLQTRHSGWKGWSRVGILSLVMAGLESLDITGWRADKRKGVTIWDDPGIVWILDLD
ncbi:hypothetical protein JAAARDRAFT_41647 [Jaapia argillacea MUCL 33604]|uniref:F-box domain-containing protein n=1 Tax=Jaapia argillacea MUCL 33604 TaxID=933084 RepID=A0A067P7V8_9AGAM|nr:hypothetical protein JAAARDRAFT_41647 [Jaapia argillacea MUCL 33604]